MANSSKLSKFNIVLEEKEKAYIYTEMKNTQNISLDICESKTSIHIVNIEIPEKLQSQGLGKKIINEVIRSGFEKRKRITLTPVASKTHTEQDLINIYTKLGFKKNNKSKLMFYEQNRN